MGANEPPDDLIEHIARFSRLDEREASRLVLEVLAYFSESVEGFVLRRHAELRADGRLNAEIYQRIGAELAGRRFPASGLSERQIRRLIYG